MEVRKVTKGMITIATGDKHYYEIAANLLLSYREFAKNPLPFAIIAEEENEYTDLFDDVVITTEAKRSFTDKFLLLKLCPYDETIFFDADCLAYGDLNEYWDFFKDATDFSALGENYDLSDNNGAWYNIDGIGEYGQMINYKTRVHAGVMFIRKTPKLDKMYDDCMSLFSDFDNLTFHTCPNSVDECILGVAMPMNEMKCKVEINRMIAAYPCLTQLKANISQGVLAYATPWHGYIEDGILLHWGTKQTYKPLYLFEVECLNHINDDSFICVLKYKFKLRYVFFKIAYIPTAVKTLYKRISKKITKKR